MGDVCTSVDVQTINVKHSSMDWHMSHGEVSALKFAWTSAIDKDGGSEWLM